MRNVMMAAIAALVIGTSMLTSCSKEIANDWMETESVKNVAFKIDGDFSLTQEPFSEAKDRADTRAGLESGGKAMTDLWIFDFVDGVQIKSLHLSGDDDMSTLTVPLFYGTHDLYFVASCGTGATVDSVNHKITFGQVSDTFWEGISLTVSSNTGSQSVTLARVVARLKTIFKDAIPSALSTININIGKCSKEIDYTTGDPVNSNAVKFTTTISSSYVGKKDVSMSYYTFIDEAGWSATATITATDKDGNSLNTVNLSSVPMERNRSTNFSGNMFTSGATFAMLLDGDWNDDYNAEW